MDRYEDEGGLMMKKNSSKGLVKMIVISLLAALSVVLFFISFPLPLLLPYLKVYFIDVPALIAGIIFSPLAGIIVVGLKNAVYLVATGVTDPVGILANFIAGSVFIFPVAYLYHRYKQMKSVVWGLVIGTVGMTIVMSILNYFIILPAYALLINLEMTPTIKLVTVMTGVLPFNIIKGVIVGLLFSLLFMKMKQWIEQKNIELAS